MEIERESIFVSSLRSFCRVFFATCGLFLAVLILSLLYSELSSSANMEEKTTLNYLPDAQGNRDTTSISSPVILQINISGVIGEPKVFDSQIFQNILLDSRTGTLARDRVKGILLHFNTPGGTVVDSDNIYRMLLEYKAKYHVPVFAYVDGLCASGGMYIACAADQIYAGPASAIGSVGVILGPFFNVFETMNKIGVEARTLTAGKDKDMLNPTRPWKEGEDASLIALTNYFYHRFVDLVAAARPRIDKNKLVQEYGAQIFDPETAQQLGYVDVANASRNEALTALLTASQIDPAKTYQVVELEPKNNWLSSLFALSPLITGKVEHSLEMGTPKIRDQFAYLYQSFEN
jgi:signal peptide peptidase SppA